MKHNYCDQCQGFGRYFYQGEEIKCDHPQRERTKQIKETAISGLIEYYSCLNDGTFVEEVRSALFCPDTGNNQLDYENVRDQVEKMAKVQEPYQGEP